MEFSVERDILLKSVSEVSKALPTRGALTILENILFDLKGNTLTLTATNLDYTIIERVEVDGREDGQAALHGKVLNQILSSLPPLEINVKRHSGGVRIVTELGNYNLMSSSPMDFPTVKTIDEEGSFSFDRDTVVRGLQAVSFCAAKDDPRPFLMGILWHVKDGELRFVASDSHKLGLFRKKVEGAEPFEAIVPKNIGDIVRAREDEEIKVKYTGDMLGIFFSNASLYTRLIEGPYAPYEDVLPKEEGNVLKADKDELLGILKRLQVFSPSPTYLVRWHISPGNIVLRASSPEIGEAEEKLQGEYSGDEMEIGFNIQYLLDILRHIEDERVVFHLYSPLSAALIHGEGEENYSLEFLLMPVKLE